MACIAICLWSWAKMIWSYLLSVIFMLFWSAWPLVQVYFAGRFKILAMGFPVFLHNRSIEYDLHALSRTAMMKRVFVERGCPLIIYHLFCRPWSALFLPGSRAEYCVALFSGMELRNAETVHDRPRLRWITPYEGFRKFLAMWGYLSFHDDTWWNR